MKTSLPLQRRTHSLRNLIPLAVLAMAVAFAPGLRAQIMDVDGAILGFGNYTASPRTWTSNSTTIWTTSANGTSDTDTWFSLGGGSSSVTQFNTSNSSASTGVTVAEDFAVQGLTQNGPRGITLSASSSKTITLSSSANITTTGGGYLTVGDNLTLSGDFTKTGNDFLRLGGTGIAKVYAGTATVNAGRLEFNNPGNTSSGTNLVLGSSGNVAFVNGGDRTIGNLSGGGASSTFFLYFSTANLTITQTSDASYAGLIYDDSTSTLGLKKSGGATLTLSGNNTYVGATTVSAGTLLINGNQTAATGNFSVSALATLGGNGTLGGAVTVADTGILAPGTSGDTTTTLTLANKNLTMAGADSKIALNITGKAAGDFDKIAGIAAFAQGGDITFTLSGTYAALDSWNVFAFTSESGNFDSITLAGSYDGTLTRSGSIWTNTNIGGQSWKFDETAGTLSVVPEPATWVLLAASLTTVMILRRRRNS